MCNVIVVCIDACRNRRSCHSAQKTPFQKCTAKRLENAGMLWLVLVWLLSVQTAGSLDISEPITGERVECSRSRIDHNVTLAEGYHAGEFLKANRSIRTAERCVKQCCQMKKCDVAFFNNGVCYSVKCKTLEACAPTKNLDKMMSIAIAFVARPKHLSTKGVSGDKTGEPEIVDNLIAEVTSEGPFQMNKQLFDDQPEEVGRTKRTAWRETKDVVVAVACGFIAVAIGVIGIITMTRKLVEDDEVDLLNKPAKIPKIDDKTKIASQTRDNKSDNNAPKQPLDTSLVNVSPKSKNTFVRSHILLTSERNCDDSQTILTPQNVFSRQIKSDGFENKDTDYFKSNIKANANKSSTSNNTSVKPQIKLSRIPVYKNYKNDRKIIASMSTH